jgi:hypothetical protein
MEIEIDGCFNVDCQSDVKKMGDIFQLMEKKHGIWTKRWFVLQCESGGSKMEYHFGSFGG